MKLSIVMPSHNVGPRVNASILNTCTMGGDDVEVIIRDNSGNAEKREFLSRIHEKNCRVILADECSGSENYRRLVDEARADFVFFVCDDDCANGLAIDSMVAEIDRIRDDPGVIGTSGIFIIDNAATTSILRCDSFNVPSAAERFRVYFETMSSVFHYSPLRRSMMKDMWSFTSKLPVFLSYQDWIINCIYLMHGRMTYVDRYLYQYSNANWATPEICVKTDIDYIRRAGLDTSGIRLQWLIAIVEGAQTYAIKYPHAPLPKAERQALASLWIQNWFPTFINSSISREAPADARFDSQAKLIAQKWRERKDFRLQEVFVDIAEFYALSSPAIGQRYHDFWK